MSISKSCHHSSLWGSGKNIYGRAHAAQKFVSIQTVRSPSVLTLHVPEKETNSLFHTFQWPWHCSCEAVTRADVFHSVLDIVQSNPTKRPTSLSLCWYCPELLWSHSNQKVGSVLLLSSLHFSTFFCLYVSFSLFTVSQLCYCLSLLLLSLSQLSISHLWGSYGWGITVVAQLLLNVTWHLNCSAVHTHTHAHTLKGTILIKTIWLLW